MFSHLCVDFHLLVSPFKKARANSLGSINRHLRRLLMTKGPRVSYPRQITSCWPSLSRLLAKLITVGVSQEPLDTSRSLTRAAYTMGDEELATEQEKQEFWLSLRPSWTKSRSLRPNGVTCLRSKNLRSPSWLSFLGIYDADPCNPALRSRHSSCHDGHGRIDRPRRLLNELVLFQCCHNGRRVRRLNHPRREVETRHQCDGCTSYQY